MGGFGISYVAGGRFDPPFMPTKTEPYTEGRLLEVYGSIGKTPDAFVADRDYEFIGISVDITEFQVRDYWNLLHNSKPIATRIYSKKTAAQTIYFVTVITVKLGDILTFEFQNEGGLAKFVMVDYQFLADEVV